MRIDFWTFRKAMSPLICFFVKEAVKHFPGFDRKRLTQWQKKGYVVQIARGLYTFPEISSDGYFYWYASNKLVKPSYISLHSALSWYGFIPEESFQVTAITSKKTRELAGKSFNFHYRNIKPRAYLGYRLLPWSGTNIRVAEPEKALVDLLYLHESMNNPDDFASWRLNREVITEQIDFSVFELYALEVQNKACYSRCQKLKKWLHAET